MRTIVKKTKLNRWILTDQPASCADQTPVAPATEPRNLSSDPAFGDFNLPLKEYGTCVSSELSTEDAADIACLQEALEEDDFSSYSDFRRDELGL